MIKYWFIIICTALFISVRSCYVSRQECKRLDNNQRALLADITFYQTKDSLSVVSVEKLTLTNREFSRYCTELENVVENLNLKIKRLESVSQTATETNYAVRTVIKNIIVPGDTDTLKCIDYQDPYLSFSGCDSSGYFIGSFQSRDTIIQVVHRVPRKFWFIKWGCKGIRQDVFSKNPHSRISYSRYIELKK